MDSWVDTHTTGRQPAAHKRGLPVGGLSLLTLILATATAGMFVACSPGPGGSGSAGDDFLRTGRTFSFFTAIQVDPRSEDSAGPQFVAAGDLNGDGRLDLVSAWNQSQPVQIHLRLPGTSDALRFETLTLAGNIPILTVAGLAVADFDNDGHVDIAVLAKDTGMSGAACLDSEVATGEAALNGVIAIYFGPDDPAEANQSLAWEEVQVGVSFLSGSGDANGRPDTGGFTSLAAGDIDLNGGVDLVVAWNSTCGGLTNDVVVFANQGPGPVRDGTWVGTRISDAFPKGTIIKDVALGDIDRDSDLDIVATFPDAGTMNIRWYRNPTIDEPDDVHISDGNWQVGTVGQIATQADNVKLGDIDGDGVLDAVVRSRDGALIQWFKGPPGPTTAPLRHIPWQVYTLAEFDGRAPETIVLGDLNFDGQVDLVASAEGGLAWFDAQGATTVYDPWAEHLIVDDRLSGEEDTGVTIENTASSNENDNTSSFTSEVAVTIEEVSEEENLDTFINSLLIVDLDGDGANDILATLDRNGLSGLSNDALVWFRNTRRPP